MWFERKWLQECLKEGMEVEKYVREMGTGVDEVDIMERCCIEFTS